MKSGRGFRDHASVDDVASGFGDRFYSTDKVAERIGEICIVKSNQPLFAVVTIFKRRHTPQQVVPEWIHTILFRLSQGVNHITKAFRNFLAVYSKIAVHEHLVRNRQAGGEKHCWPVERMKTVDSFTDDMNTFVAF